MMMLVRFSVSSGSQVPPEKLKYVLAHKVIKEPLPVKPHNNDNQVINVRLLDKKSTEYDDLHKDNGNNIDDNFLNY